MSPNGQAGAQPNMQDNIYTVILALAFGAVLATTALVAFICFSQYGTIFSIYQ